MQFYFYFNKIYIFLQNLCPLESIFRSLRNKSSFNKKNQNPLYVSLPWQCVAFSSQFKEGSHPVRGNVVNVADTVPSAYLQLVLNNRKPGEISSPVITPGLFFPSSPYSIQGPTSNKIKARNVESQSSIRGGFQSRAPV